MGSTRFPGKVMADLDGKPMIGHLLDELKKCKRVDKVIVASPHPKIDVDWKLAEFVDCLQIYGPEEDVAERFRLALEACPCDYFIRVCADSPLITARHIDELTTMMHCGPPPIWTCQNWTADREGRPQLVYTDTFLKALPFFDDHDREHVTTFFTRRLVVDTPEDLDYVRRWIEFSKLVS